MRIGDSFNVVQRDDECFIVNIDNGDVFLINDVTLDIVTQCGKYETIDDLCVSIYEKYSGEGDYTKEELKSFLCEMVQSGIITK